MSLKQWITVYLKGAAMGAADAVPGVSGGTIALITGIYERLIDSLSSPDFEKISRTVKLVKTRDFQGLVGLMVEMDLPFLAVLGAGVISSLFFVLNLMHFLLESYAVETYGFFLGLIAASAALIYSEVDISSRKSQVAALSGFLGAFLVSGIGTNTLGHNPFVVFLSGAIAVSAMILPGISGSLMLVILGQYEYMSQTVSGLTEAVLNFFQTGNPAEMIESGAVVFTFVLGAFTGVLSLVKLVDYALERHRQATMAFLVSLMLGALRAPIEQIDIVLQDQGVLWVSALPEVLTAAALGGIVIFLIDRRTAELG